VEASLVMKSEAVETLVENEEIRHVTLLLILLQPVQLVRTVSLTVPAMPDQTRGLVCRMQLAS
jgi:hypothetical protein